MEKRIFKILFSLFWGIGLFLSACGHPGTPTVSLSLEPSPTTAVTPTLAPTKTATPLPTETFVQPSSTPTVALSGLTNAYPSIEEIASALQPHVSEAEYSTLALNGKTFYQDVNGDQQDDLIFQGYASVSVFIWLGEAYSSPFALELSPGHYFSASKISFEDWTNDGVLELVFDYVEATGGSGLSVDIWEKHIIQCLESQCHPIWEGVTTMLVDEHPVDRNGMAILDSKIRLTENEGQLWLEQSLNAFTWWADLYSSSWLSQLPDSLELSAIDENGIASLYFDTSVVFQRNFLWTGNIFELRTEEITQPPTPLAFPTPIYEATGPNGEIARLHIDYLDYLYPNKICQLIVQDTLPETKFGCLPDTTAIEWKDITNDGVDEIIVTALSWPYSVTSEPLTEKDECIHQRLIAYQWDGTSALEIANVNGCVVQADFFGVRLEDIDGDGQVEIIAADKWKTFPDFTRLGCCWYEFIRSNQVYKWDGGQFVSWQNVPRD